MLAQGDSWFDYPLGGRIPLVSRTDVVAQLKDLGKIKPIILNLAQHGETSVGEMSLSKQQEMIEALQDKDNWPGTGKPDAILFSAGGNDIAGDQFCIFLNYNDDQGSIPFNRTRFDKALGAVEASYLALFAFRDKYAKDVPIYGHCYDFPIPNGEHPDCIGPWLKPSFEHCGWSNLTQNTEVIEQALTEFKAMLVRLSADPKNKFILVGTQGVLTPPQWANELHPTPPGFVAIANKFVDKLRVRFPGRI
jgi:hypothetical protein